MDHSDRIHHAHSVRLALHRANGRQPRPQGRRPKGRGVELMGKPAESGCSKRVAAFHVAAPTGPEEISRLAMLLETVNMADLHACATAA